MCRLLIKPSSYALPDQALPRADTCFFNVELPAYSTEDIMRTKLLFAVRFALSCVVSLFSCFLLLPFLLISCSTALTMNADDELEGLHENRQGNRIHRFAKLVLHVILSS